MSYFQDALETNHCYGCGSSNEHGLKIKSYWYDQKHHISHCDFKPQAFHCAAPLKFLNGGIMATIIDCHCIITATAYAYQLQGRNIGQGQEIWYATSKLSLEYLRPVSISSPLLLIACVKNNHRNDLSPKHLSLQCNLVSQDKICVKAKVDAVLVPAEWMS